MERKHVVWWSLSSFCWPGGPTSLSFCPSDRSHHQHGRHRALRGSCRHLYISGDHFTFIRDHACLPIGKDKCSFSGCFLKLFAINFWPSKVPLSLDAVHFFLRRMFIKTSTIFSNMFVTNFGALVLQSKIIWVEMCLRWTECLSRLVRSSPYPSPPPLPALGQLASLR